MGQRRNTGCGCGGESKQAKKREKSVGIAGEDRFITAPERGGSEALDLFDIHNSQFFDRVVGPISDK